MNPIYDDALVLNLDKNISMYYTLYAKRRNVSVNDVILDEDDCLIAYSDVSKDEIVQHRSKLIAGGYYKPIELYLRNIPNFNYKRQ